MAERGSDPRIQADPGRLSLARSEFREDLLDPLERLLRRRLRRHPALDDLHPAGREDVLALHTQFLSLLDEGDQVHPRAPTTPGKRGKARQHPARNLLDRLRKYQDAVLAFLYDLNVDFDNNLAERDVRMVKVQQKVSGTFRSDEGAVSFCRIRGYLSSLRKQSLHVFSALEATLLNQPLLPSF